MHFIQPGKPTQHAFVESVNGKFRDLFEARRVIDEWRQHCNNVRPHSLPGYLPPAVFAKPAA